jgi:hypothetical protein
MSLDLTFVHADVGGGSVDNGTPYTLAKIALRWMIRETFETDTGIMFHSETLRTIGLDPASLYPYVQKRPPPLPVAGTLIQSIPPAQNKTPLQHFSDVESLVKIHKTEEEHELHDAMAPIYDQLSLAWSWWVLELFPMRQHYQRSDNTWGKYYAANLGRGRFIPGQKKRVIKVHRSVKMRMESESANGEKYVPRASFKRAMDLGKIEWVD